MKVHAVRRGLNPNCSATGSVVGIALVTVGAAAVVLNAFADRFVRWLERGDGPGDTPPGEAGGEPGDAPPPVQGPDAEVRVRREADGALIAWPEPPALLQVDDEAADAALRAGARLVTSPPAPPGALSAPTEVHLAVTDRCPVACTGCYLSAGPGRGAVEPGLRDELRALARLGVLEVAFGGGEALLREDLVALAHEARSLGLVPNLTTSGFGLNARKARELRVFGQVNVSLDGLGEAYQAVRGWDGAALGLRALRLLREAGVRTGVNTVLTRHNLDQLEALGDALQGLTDEWQWLRFKPSGRGEAAYADLALTPDQRMALWPRLLALEARTGLAIRVDCALVPFLVAHGPPLEALKLLGLTGCPGGHSLWARSARGGWSPCSFADDHGTPDWQADPALQAWRARAADPPEPCASCAYQAVCRGGCRIVARHLTGDALAPDPECPRVCA